MNHQFFSRGKRRVKIKLFFLFLLFCEHFHFLICLQLGFTKVDITGPAAETGIADFTQIGRKLSGIQQKQFARAYVFKEENQVSLNFLKVPSPT